jgi:hypothetical protein
VCCSEVAEDWRVDAKCLLRDLPCKLHLRQIFPGQSLSISLAPCNLLMLCVPKLTHNIKPHAKAVEW